MCQWVILNSVYCPEDLQVNELHRETPELCMGKHLMDGRQAGAGNLMDLWIA